MLLVYTWLPGNQNYLLVLIIISGLACAFSWLAPWLNIPLAERFRRTQPSSHLYGIPRNFIYDLGVHSKQLWKALFIDLPMIGGLKIINNYGYPMKILFGLFIAAASLVAISAHAAPNSVSGKISLSPALVGKVAPTDTVFVLARAAQGPRMPLAVFRKQVKDLPMDFTLDDSMAMQPQMKLSGFQQVVVAARVSKSGGAMSQPGDFEGISQVIKPGTTGLNIVIDTVVK